MNDLLVMLTFALAWVHQGRDRVAVLSFGVPLLAFGIVDEYIPEDMGTLYHLGVTAIDLAILYYLTRFVHLSELIVNLQIACEAFIYINLLGWIAYMRYIPPETYNQTCSLVYAWVLIKIISGSGWRGFRDLTMDRWCAWVRGGNRAGGFAPVSNKEAFRN